MKEKLQQWFAALNPREKILVGIGAAAVALFVLFLAILEPLHKGIKQLRSDVADSRELVTQLLQAQAQTGGRAGGGIQDRQRSLLSIIDQTSKQAGLGSAMKRMQPDGETTVRIWLELADFGSLARWLGMMEKTYGAVVSEADISRDAQPGTVRARIDLVRATP